MEGGIKGRRERGVERAWKDSKEELG
jgi:hypothetical protein